jgi:hypothetical protein
MTRFFLCPVCSERRSDSEGAGPCGTCGTGYPVDAVDPQFHLLAQAWTPGETDGDASARRVADALRAAGRVAHLVEKQSYDLPGGEAIRLILTQRQDGGMTLVTIATGEWSEELALLVLNVLLPISNQMEVKGPPVNFCFLAALPLPDPIRTIFESSARGRFERLAMGQTEVWDVNVPVDPARTDELTGIAATLVKACFRIPLQGTMADVVPLNDLVPQRFRFPLGPDDPLLPGSYIPAASLLLLGLLVGRAIRASAHPPCAWVSRPESSFGLTLSTYMRSTGTQGVSNIIDKMFKLFQNGAEDAVDFMARVVVDETKR